MPNVRLSIGDAVRFSWAAVKQNTGLVIGIAIVAIVVPLLPSFIAEAIKQSGGALASSSFIFGLISGVLSIIVGLGMIRVSLTFASGQRPKVAELFSEYRHVFSYIGASILYGLAVLAGLILLIVPGIILALRYSLFSYFVVERNLGPIASLKASAQATKGAKGALLGLGLVLGLINFAGFLALLVGYLFTYPMTAIAMAYAYRVLTADISSEATSVVPPVPPPLPPLTT